MMARAVQETGDPILDDLYSRLQGVRKRIDWKSMKPKNGRYPETPEESAIQKQIDAREAFLATMAQQGSKLVQLESSP